MYGQIYLKMITVVFECILKMVELIGSFFYVFFFHLSTEEEEGENAYNASENTRNTVQKVFYFCIVGSPNQPPLIMFFLKLVVRCLQNNWIRIFILVIWVITTIICGFMIPQMKEGLELGRIGRYDSIVSKYYQAEDDYFRVLNFRIHVAITDANLDYGDSKTQERIQKLLKDFQDLPLISDDEELNQENWLDFYSMYKKGHSINDNGVFTKKLSKALESSTKTPFLFNVKFSDDKKNITASRFMLQTENIKDPLMEIELVNSLREIADASPFNVTVFNPFFPYFDQFIKVRPNTLQTIAISTVVVLLVTFMLIPNIYACVVLVINFASIAIQVCGFMVLWDIYLDVISMIAIIMCIGFSVGKYIITFKILNIIKLSNECKDTTVTKLTYKISKEKFFIYKITFCGQVL